MFCHPYATIERQTDKRTGQQHSIYRASVA